MKLKRIAIIGLGLMGASLAASLKRKFPGIKITGVSRSARTRAFAKRKKLVYRTLKKISPDLGGNDLIILCTPVDTLPAMLSRLDSVLDRKTLVTDVGSTKAEVQSFADRKNWKHISFVGSHPLVGSEKRGIGAFQPCLYDQGLVFVVKGKRTAAKDIARITAFWKKVCSRVVQTSAKRHDAIVAEISHLPHVAALSLMHAVKNASLKFAASGFRDSTRVAMGDVSIWLPIMLSNHQPVSQSVRKLQKSLSRFQKALRRRDARALKSLINQAKSRRSKM